MQGDGEARFFFDRGVTKIWRWSGCETANCLAPWQHIVKYTYYIHIHVHVRFVVFCFPNSIRAISARISVMISLIAGPSACALSAAAIAALDARKACRIAARARSYWCLNQYECARSSPFLACIIQALLVVVVELDDDVTIVRGEAHLTCAPSEEMLHSVSNQLHFNPLANHCRRPDEELGRWSKTV